MSSALALFSADKTVFVRQRRELAEAFLGVETRNKYEIASAAGAPLAYCAEQQKGVLGFLARQFLGHWRSFELHFFDAARNLAMVAHHPFRFFFQALELRDAKGERLGLLQQRFALFSKRFEVSDARGRAVMEMRSGLFRPWTFPFMRRGREVARISKKWSGLLREALTDADNFTVTLDETLEPTERALVVAAAIFVDLVYFERKAGS